MEGLRVDLPYPGTKGLSADEESARIISSAYADAKSEMTAILQYSFQSTIFNGIGQEKTADTLFRIGLTEMEHLEILAETLYALGAIPIYVSQPPKPCDFYSSAAVSRATHPKKMIMDDIIGESEAIRGYENMVRRLKNEQVAAIISRIILDEKLHLETLKKILEDMNAEAN